MKATIRALAAAAALLVAGALQAAGGPETRLEPYTGNVHDEASLQRGAKLFVNYCLNCHSAQYMRYNRLQDIGLTEDQIRANLIFTGAKVGEKMLSGISRADAKDWFGGPVPDLSVESRVRGTQWLYNYLLAFYRDESPTGWNNLVFPGVSMPHVLWELGGAQKLAVTEHKNHGEAKAALVALRGVGILEPPVAKDGPWRVRAVSAETSGSMSASDYRRAVTDLVNYLDFMGEPVKIKRGAIGIVTLIFLGLLFALALMLKKEYWKDIR